MRVIAAPGCRVPMLTPGQFIEPAPADAVTVEDISYYRRRVATGELLRVPDEVPAAAEVAQDVTAAAAKPARRSAKQTAPQESAE